ncbi:Phosphatidyl-myo-inositol mannosyltransferase [subsurface metagenome]
MWGKIVRKGRRECMRIAFITFQYPPFITGGSGIYAINITSKLSELGHQVIVFTPKINNLEEKCNINNLEIRRIRINERLPFKALQFWLRLPKAVKKTENEKEFDIIHFNGISYWFLKKRISKAPHVLTVHHPVKDARRSNNPSLISRIRDIGGENGFFVPYVEKRCIKYADKFIAVSNFTKRRIIETYKVPSDKIEVVYNGIDLNGYTFTKEELKETKKQFNLTEKPIILFVGRVDDPRKGLDLLLKASKKVLKKFDAKLLVVGKEDQSKARRLANSLGISKNVVFTGFVDEVTLKKCYVLCDIYVCPSRLEGFGLTILEAMAAGKPIVATNVGAIPEIITNGENGILIKSDKTIGLAEALSIYLQDKKLAEGVGTRNRIYVKENFSWKKAAETLQIIYKKQKREVVE